MIYNFHKAIGEKLVEAASELGFDAAFVIAGDNRMGRETLRACRDAMATSEVKITILPFGASQPQGVGRLAPLWYSSFVVDARFLKPNRFGNDFSRLIDHFAQQIHWFTSGHYRSFITKYVTIYNGMSVETSTRRIRIDTLDNHITSLITCWIVDTLEYRTADEPEMIPTQSVGGGESTQRKVLTDEFILNWSEE